MKLFIYRIKFLRFTNEEVIKSADKVVFDVKYFIEKLCILYELLFHGFYYAL